MDVVVPFAGGEESLERIARALAGLELHPGDSVVVADNTPAGRGGERTVSGVRVVPARGLQSSYFARNRGAETGSNEWLVFLDADVEPPADLVERYFAEPAGERTAVLVGSVRDQQADGAARAPASVRYAYLRAFIDQEGTMSDERWAYAKTANCAVRRAAFQAIGGFREDVRSGGDADLCFRLKDAGWQLEWRRDAEVVHRSRDTVRRFLRQTAKHGAGSEWLDRRYPGFSPRSRSLGLAYWTSRRTLEGTFAALRGDRDGMLLGYLDAARSLAFRVGRMLPNDVRPDPDRAD